MIPNRVLLKDGRIQKIIAFNCAVGVMSVLFLVILGPTPFNLMIVFGGWTSAGAWILGNYGVVKIVRAELTVDAMGGLERVVKFIDELDTFLNSDEVLALIDLLGNKAKNKKEE